MLEHELGKTVYFLRYGKIHSGKVIGRKYSDKIENIYLYADGPQGEWIKNVIGGNCSGYAVYDNVSKGSVYIEGRDAFSTDKELIDSLYIKDGV